MGKNEKDRQNDEMNEYLKRGDRAKPQSDRVKRENVDEQNRNKDGKDNT